MSKLSCPKWCKWYGFLSSDSFTAVCPLDITHGAATVPWGTSHSRKTASKHVGSTKGLFFTWSPFVFIQTLVIQMHPALCALLICYLIQLQLPSRPPWKHLTLASNFYPLDLNSASKPDSLLLCPSLLWESLRYLPLIKLFGSNVSAGFFSSKLSDSVLILESVTAVWFIISIYPTPHCLDHPHCKTTLI